MPRRRKLVLLVAAIAVAVAAVWICMPSGPEEPEYQGRTLSEWMDIVQEANFGATARESSSSDEAAAAIRAIGTNALPTVLKWMDYEPSKREATLARLASKLPVGESGRSKLYSAVLKRRTQAGNATSFFAIVTSNASPIVPNLIRFMQDTNAPERSARAAFALAMISTNAWPALEKQLAMTNSEGKTPVLAAISFAHHLGHVDWSVALPQILRHTDHKDANVAASAIHALGLMKLDPETCVAVCTNKLNSPSPAVRAAALRALQQFAPSAGPAIPTIEGALNDPDHRVRSYATNTLETIRSHVATNTPSK